MTEERKVTWPVKVSVPVDGKSKTHSFQVTFHLLGLSETKAIVDQARVAAENDVYAVAIDDASRELLRRAVVGWSGVVDENENEIPFKDERLEALLDIPYVFAALNTAYVEAAHGGRRKN
ncbi:MAG: hypothetical protein ACPGYL_05095 [Rhodospirillaceae bacterium]